MHSFAIEFEPYPPQHAWKLCQIRRSPVVGEDKFNEIDLGYLPYQLVGRMSEPSTESYKQLFISYLMGPMFGIFNFPSKNQSNVGKYRIHEPSGW